MKKIIKSIINSTHHGVRNDPEVRKIISKYPHIFQFIKKRLTPNEKYGLYLTIGSIFTLFFVFLFFGIIQDYIGQETLIKADLRIINLISQYRNPNLNQFMLFITYLAKAQVITVAVIFSLIILFLLNKWSYLKNLLVFVLGGELFVWIIKNIIERPRPPLATALVTETSYSFPSGHSFIAIAFYGLITFFIFESLNKKYLKKITLIIGIILIILISFSRIYLGAHWPSDVLASYASGLAWLSIIITISHIKKKFHPIIVISPKLKHKTIIQIAVLLLILFFIFTYNFYKNHPLKEISQTLIPKTIINSTDINTKLFETLPKVSENITASPAEPINFIIIADKETLNKAFVDSGWYLLDPIGVRNTIKIIKSILTKTSYPQTPALPVFWDTRPADFSFGKPESQNPSARQHIHLWETKFITPDSQSIWVGTAHFDQSVKTKFKIIMPIHTTELIVDNQRERLKNNLDQNGFVASTEKINLTGLTYVTKKSGNKFLTDGQAYILYLKNNEKPTN